MSSQAAKKVSPTTAPKRRPKGAKPRLTGDERRAQILDVAVGLFRAQGIHATRMSDIAAACNITKPVLYSHFPSKDSLFEASLSAVAAALTQKLISALANHEGPDQSLESLQALMDFVRDHGALLSAGDGTSRATAIVDQHHTQVITAVAHILAGQRPADMDEARALEIVQPWAFTLLGAAEGGARWWQQNPHVPTSETKRLSRLVLDSFLTLVRQELAQNA
ncbi:MAG: TetR/AcrR family transcriptional regulator [Alphaproteobacteria bacterium]